MGLPDAATREFLDLMSDLAEGRLPPDKAARLQELMSADPALCRKYVDFMMMVGGMHWTWGGRAGNENTLVGGEADDDAPLLPAAPGDDSAARPQAAPPPSPAVVAISALGGFGGVLLPYATTALLLVAAIAAAWTWPAGGTGSAIGTQAGGTGLASGTAAGKGKPIVGRITGMRDCQWGDSRVFTTGSPVALGEKFDLVSGVVEITYWSGAKVVVRGTSLYEVDTRNGGLLKFGIAAFLCRTEPGAGRIGTASKDQPVFRVHTPTPQGPSTYSLQDVDLVLQVDRKTGDVMSRNISPAVMSWSPTISGKYVVLPGNPRTLVGVRGANQKPVFVIARPAQPSDGKPGTSPETTVYSGDSKKKQPAEGGAKGQKHGPNS